MIVLVNTLTLLSSDHTRTLVIVFWRTDKMFVKGQDCVSHTLEIIDKNSRYNGQLLFQVRNRECFGTVENSWDYSNSIKV